MSSRAPIPYQRALIVANPIAGTGRGERYARALDEALRAAGLLVELRFTSRRGDAPEFVAGRHPETDLVIVVGGDGTVGEALAALPRELPLALVPLGTANVMSLDLKIPRRLEGTLAMLASGRRTGLDVARVNGRLSFLVTGIGPDGAAVREVDRRRDGPIHKFDYVVAIWHTLRHWRAQAMRVELDGEALPQPYHWVLVSNVIGYGGLFRLSPRRRLDDGLWEVYLFPRGSRWALLCYALRAILLGLPGGDCRMRQARRVRLLADAPLPIEVDGDYAGEATEIEIEVQPGPYTLLLP